MTLDLFIKTLAYAAVFLIGQTLYLFLTRTLFTLIIARILDKFEKKVNPKKLYSRVMGFLIFPLFLLISIPLWFELNLKEYEMVYLLVAGLPLYHKILKEFYDYRCLFSKLINILINYLIVLIMLNGKYSVIGLTAFSIPFLLFYNHMHSYMYLWFFDNSSDGEV